MLLGILLNYSGFLGGREEKKMVFQKEYLDLLLVPSGLFIMFTYHLYLLYRYLTIPHTTIMGFENNDKRAWVERIMQVKYIYIQKRVQDLNLTILAFNSSCICVSRLRYWIQLNSLNIGCT